MAKTKYFKIRPGWNDALEWYEVKDSIPRVYHPNYEIPLKNRPIFYDYQMSDTNKHLEHLIFSAAISDKGETYKFLYLLAIKEILKLKGYCSLEHLSYLFSHHYKIVHRNIAALEREGLAYMSKGMLTLSKEGRREIYKITDISSEVYNKLTENKSNIKRIDDENNPSNSN